MDVFPIPLSQVPKCRQIERGREARRFPIGGTDVRGLAVFDEGKQRASVEIIGWIDFEYLQGGGEDVDRASQSGDPFPGLKSVRGPDDQGIWVDSTAGIALGHRRLSIIDLSQHGHQPMHSACGRYVMVYNGEIYNYVELRSALEKKGVTFNTSSDTEVLLQSYIQYGIDCTKKFEGMWSFAIWDFRINKLFLSRDRFSEKDLKKIFKKENNIHFTKIEEKRYELYWTPLIGVFSGLRLGEITSLYIDNVREIKGSHREKRLCFDIVVEPERTDKHLKTQSSRRIVPVHDTLIELGLIEFIQLLKIKDPKRERLFQELKYKSGNYNQNVSRWFNTRYLPLLGLKTDKKNFHSLRHTVSDHLKQKGIEPHFVNELLGHSSGNIDLERYGKGYNPDILFNKCVKKIFYETSHTRGIDFKSLKMDWKKIIG